MKLIIGGLALTSWYAIFLCLDDIAIMIDDVSYLLFDHFLNIAASNFNDFIIFIIVYSVQSLESCTGFS